MTDTESNFPHLRREISKQVRLGNRGYVEALRRDLKRCLSAEAEMEREKIKRTERIDGGH